MKTLRRNRLLLGWFMAFLVAVLQVTPPAMAATFFWAPGGDSASSGDWNLGDLNWGLTVGTGGSAWTNGDIAVFGDSSNPATLTVSLTQSLTAGGLRFNTSENLLEGLDASKVLTLNGATPTIKIG
ncbi:MAG: hypothetical protein JNG86_01235, partial [Verrucomicrobiaceae bacterium]|nr:hypothetical protein [Verrucomicrobiaceae bacterium]